MDTKRVGKLTLAFTLIFIGVVLLFRNRIDVLNILEIYIPSALILLGLELLVSKLYYERKGFQVKADVGSIVLTLIIAIAIGGLLTTVRIFDGNMMGMDFPNLNIVNQAKYRNEKEIEGTIEVETASKLRLETEYSDVEILRGEGEKTRVEGVVKYRYNQDESSELKLEDIIKVEKEGETLSISYKKRAAETLNKIGVESISYRIYIPEKTKAADMRVNYSDLSAKDVKFEKTDIDLNYGDMHLYSVAAGKCDIAGNYGYINIENGVGEYKIKTNYADIDVNGIEGSMDFSSNYGDVEIKNISDKLTAKMTYSNLELLSSEVMKGGIAVDGSYSDVNLDLPLDQDGLFDIEVKQGNIDMGKFRDKSGLNISQNSVSGSTGGSDMPVEIRLDSGNISFE